MITTMDPQAPLSQLLGKNKENIGLASLYKNTSTHYTEILYFVFNHTCKMLMASSTTAQCSTDITASWLWCLVTISDLLT